jgi:hypothetical protein
MDDERYSMVESETEYYLLDNGELGRLEYDPDADEYFDAAILNEFGEWDECAVWQVLSDGEEITPAKAKEFIRQLGEGV